MSESITENLAIQKKREHNRRTQARWREKQKLLGRKPLVLWVTAAEAGVISTALADFRYVENSSE